MPPSYKSAKYERGFTLVGLGCSIAVAFLLLLLVSPALTNRAAKAREILCMANQRQLARAMHLYVDDNRDIFPAHRETHEDGPLPAKWWGTSVLGYVGGSTNLYRCPLLSGERVGPRRVSDWAFNAYEVRYGYNAFFLGIAPYDTTSIIVAGVRFTGTPWFKRSNIIRPSDNLLLGDRDASSATPQPMWTSTLWWPVAGSDGMFKEGVAPRHRKRGVVIFNDGHAEVRSSARINPPLDPSQGHPRALINSGYWDPLKVP